MPTPQAAPYGAWQSPLSAAEVYADSVRLRDLRLDGDMLYWLEGRPDGRSVLVRRLPDGTQEDVTPPGFSVRTRVHEYGGAAYGVDRGVVYFSNFADQRLYRQRPGQPPELLTPQEGLRYADGVVDRARNRLIVVREDHTAEAQPINTLTAIDLSDGSRQQVMAQGCDFYAAPRLSPDGTRLAWLSWNHPNMPWDGCELWVAEVQPDGTLAGPARVAGGMEESICQPEWGPDGTLYFVSDRSGWWNLYRRQNTGQIDALHPLDAEFGQPQWSFGQSTYAVEPGGHLLCSYEQTGITRLARLDTQSLAWRPIDLPYTEMGGLRAGGGRLYFFGSSPTSVSSVVALDLTSGATEVIRRSRAETLGPAYISVAQPVVFPTRLPTGEESSAYAYFYAPHNPDYTAPAGERPPLVLMNHGGPTSATSTALSYAIQFWTTRGVAVMDVDYGGSTGYGRAYRQRLNGQWGVVDVVDCVNAATYAAEQGWVDAKRMAIRGGSAGGFTTLAALTFYDRFTAGASYFGISDLEVFVHDTHKFESRYLDGLVGPYPEARDLYVARSPIHAVDRLACPLLVLQGLDDPVVPPNQAEMMVEAVRARGLPVAYVPFPGEQHGFVKAENNRRALEAELSFYGRVFGFEPAGELEPLAVENL